MTMSILIVARTGLTKSKSWCPYLAYGKYFAKAEGDLLAFKYDLPALGYILASICRRLAILYEAVPLIMTFTAIPFCVDC